jgi:hypothetical protein
MKRKIYSLLGMLLVPNLLLAQQHLFNYPTVIANTIPLSTATTNMRQSVYYPTDFATASAGSITDIYIQTSTAGTPNFSTLTIKMGHSSISTFTPSFITTGMQTVFNGPYNSSTISTPNGNFLKITLQTPFSYNYTDNLIVEISQGGYSPGIQIYQANGAFAARTLFGASTSATGTVQDRLAVFGFDMLSTPCTSPVTAGTSTKSPTTNVCPGTTVSLDLNGNDVANGITFEWESSPNNAAGSYVSIGASQTTPATQVQPTATTWYRCKVVCNGGTPSYSTPVQVNVDVVNVNLGNDTTYCEGNNAILLNAGNPGSSYLWDDASTAQTRMVNTAGTYYVTVTSSAGCVGSDTINVGFSPAATGDYTATEATNGLVNFSATANNSNSYFWQFGHNNATANGPTASYTYPSNGFYNVTLNLTNDCGDTTKITKSVTVNTVTGVGINDLIKDAKINIYPNPAKEVIVIENKDKIIFEQITIVDVLGRSVYNSKNIGSSKEYKIDIQTLKSGTYYLKVQTSEGLIVNSFTVL